jgi:DNA-binding CsgD family transcriptional regulator
MEQIGAGYKDPTLVGLSRTIFESPSPESFLNFLCLHTFRPISASGVILGKIEKQGLMKLVSTFGFQDEEVTPFTEIPLWMSTPITDCVKNRNPIIFYSQQELFSEYPALTGSSSKEDLCTVSIPIISGNVALGALGITCEKFPKNAFRESSEWWGVMNLVGIYLKFIAPSFEYEAADSIDQQLLSDRQITIIQMFEDGLTGVEMARKLHVSLPTIKSEITKIFKIFNTRSREEICQKFKSAFVDTHSLSALPNP